ncbi:MAG: TonB-dependent siderophore receptor [Sphingobium sp.]
MLATTAMAGLAISMPAHAQTATHRSFNIPAQSLADALMAFGQQSGLNVSAPADLTRGLSSPGVSGSLAPAEALSRLLTGTGLTFRFTGPRSVQLEAAPRTADGAIELGPVRVEGDGGAASGIAIAPSITSDPDATEATGSFTTRRMASATRLPLTLRETPQAVTVITNARIEQENLVNLIDVVDTTPGLLVTYDAIRPTFTSRGHRIDRITQDGITTLHDSYIPSSLGNMAMQDRVEVVRGATGLMQGGGNPSGAINLIRKRPTENLQIKGAASVGSWNDYRLTADVSGPLTADGRIRARAVGFFQNADNFRDIEFDDSRLGYVTVDFDLTERTTFNLGYSYFKSRTNMIWGGIPLNPDGTHLDVPRSTFVGTDWDHNDNSVHTVYASLVHAFDSGWNFKLNATYVDASNDLLATYVQPTTDVGGFGHVWWATKKNRKQKAVDAYLSGPVTLFGRSHELVIGGTVNDDRSDITEWFESWDATITSGVDLSNWNHVAPRPDLSADSPWRYAYPAHNKQQSLYTAGRFSLADPLSLTLGARLDWYDRTSLWGGDGYSVKAHLTKYAGLTWAFEAHHSAYVSYTDVFQPQSSRSIDGDFLPPVIGKNYEIGIKGEYLDGALNSSVVLFRLDESNRSVLLTDQSDCPIYPGESCYAAAGLVRTWGIDTELQGQLAPGWQIGAGFTWSRTRYAKDEDTGWAIYRAGTRVDTAVPTTQFKLSTQYRLPGALDQFTIGGRMSWQSKIYNDFENESSVAVRNQQRPFAIVDLSATYRPTEHLSLQVEVNNVFDKRYYRNISSGYAWSAGELFGDPRNILATLRASF